MKSFMLAAFAAITSALDNKIAFIDKEIIDLGQPSPLGRVSLHTGWAPPGSGPDAYIHPQMVFATNGYESGSGNLMRQSQWRITIGRDEATGGAEMSSIAFVEAQSLVVYVWENSDLTVAEAA